MLVIRQDRMTVVNLDHILRFGVSAVPTTEESAPDAGWAILADFSRNTPGEVLGQYESKERAMEVLREIADEYKRLEVIPGTYSASAGAFIKPSVLAVPKVYEMPEV